MNRLLNLNYGRTLRMMIRPSIAAYSTPSKIDERFKSAVENLNKLKDDPGNDVKLNLYALYKQATVGQCNAPKPSVFNMVAVAKWNAWNSLGTMTNDDAMQQYAKTVEKLVADGGSGDGSVTGGGSNSSGGDNELIVEKINGVCWIRMNRPTKFNAITRNIYNGISSALKDASADDGVKLAVITGTGDYYSSGNDLSNFQQMIKEYGGDFRRGAIDGSKILREYVASYIDFNKPLIGAVNGHAIGIAVTTLGLMDYVIASDTATFYTPFTSLGQSPEACATYTFPKIMGNSYASQMLMFNYKMSAKEAEACGFVGKVVPQQQFHSYVNDWLYGDKGIIKTCYPKSMMFTRGMIRNPQLIAKLHETNKIECETIIDRWTSDECADALQKFFTRKQSNL